MACFCIVLIQLYGCQSPKTENIRPNILFVISDDQSFAHTSYAGCQFVETPAFDKIASEGIYFTNCYASSPGCAPSRSALVTGRHHWQNEQAGQHASGWLKKFVPFVDALVSNGYYTGYTGKGVDPFQYRNEKIPNDSFRIENAAGRAYNSFYYSDQHSSLVKRTKEISATNYFENFKNFMAHKKKEEPFYFWFGANEPHRKYEKGAWKRMGKKLEEVHVPDFLPDNDEVRGDLLDYAVEIEWFDYHLQRMISYLDKVGELENTIIIVTSDNGMPFPRAKANCFEYGVHVPLAIRCPKYFPGGRTVDDPISFVDFAPTILELTNTKLDALQAVSGKSITHILKSKKQGVVDSSKKYVFSGRERHSSSRWNNLGYPQRAIRGRDYLYVWNLKPERWPAGAPQRLKSKTSQECYPLYGIDENGIHQASQAFTDVDASPTKSYLVEHHGQEESQMFFDWAFAKRPEEELYNVASDPYCLNNLVGLPEYRVVQQELKSALLKELQRSNDPRIVGPDKEVFDSYIRYMHMRYFPKPNSVVN